MFASLALAARIDRAEMRLTESVGRAILASVPGSRAFVETIAGGVAVYAGPLRPFVTVDGFRLYCAWVDGELAGTATLRIDDGVAQMCGASTLPRFRRRGVQAALLRRRLSDGARAGCDLAVITTEPSSTSQENGHRQGFALLYARAILVKTRCRAVPSSPEALLQLDGPLPPAVGPLGPVLLPKTAPAEQ